MAFLVILTIAVSLFISRELISFLKDQNIQAVIFVLGMIMIGAALIINAFKTKAAASEIAIWIGLAAVYVMLFLRLGLAERSHLMEYSILAMLVHRALIERRNNGFKVPSPGWLAFGITFAIGLLDECVQLFIPHRVFDWYDIVFNGIVILAAILSLVALSWLKKKLR